MADYGEASVSAYSLVPIQNNATSVILAVPNLCAGVYSFAGNWGLKVDPGVNIVNHHADIGTNPASIDTAPAGGSTLGCHEVIPGDPNLVTFVKLVGRRILTVNAGDSVYLRTIAAWSPATASCRAFGCLNWVKIA